MRTSIQKSIVKAWLQLERLKENKYAMKIWNSLSTYNERIQFLISACTTFNEYHEGKIDSEVTAYFGKIKDESCFYDVCIGRSGYLGAITMDSLKKFGNTVEQNRFYICINSSFTRFEIIDASRLLRLIKDTPVENKKYLGELDYKDLI